MCLYVRDIKDFEGRKLQQIVRRSTNRIKVRRAQVILSSAQGFKVPRIAEMLYYSPEHVRTIIKGFDTDGFSALEPKYGVGRPPKFSEDQQSLIVEVAMLPPDLIGQPFKRWSLPKLRDYVIAEKIVSSISIETLRQLLRKHKVKLQRTKTWKECNDPKVKSKKN